MKDKLEQLVKDNRSVFDDKVPGHHVWKNIELALDGKRKFLWLWKAAAVIFFISTIGMGAQLWLTGQQEKETIASTDFESVENFYFNMISEKKSLIYDFEARDVNINQDFEQDMQKLDAMYQVLKEELKANPSKKVVDALILNLLIRIDILNEQLQHLDENAKPTTEDSMGGEVNT